MKRIQHIHRYIYAIMILTVTACKKEITSQLPGPPDDAFNLYNASDVLNSMSQASVYENIFIDAPIDKNSPTGPRQPAFSGALGQFEYPYAPVNDAYHAISYMRAQVGIHHFIFTDTGRNAVLDTSLQIPHGYTQLYLTDAVLKDNSPAAYRLFAVPEPHTPVTVGKIKLRMIHLSSDLGAINCTWVKADGSKTSSPLPQQLSFGQASPYIELDTAGVTPRIGMILNFSSAQDTAKTIATAILPSTPGRAYIIIVQGFKNAAIRQIPTTKTGGGTTQFTPMTILPNLRTYVRETY